MDISDQTWHNAECYAEINQVSYNFHNIIVYKIGKKEFKVLKCETPVGFFI